MFSSVYLFSGDLYGLIRRLCKSVLLHLLRLRFIDTILKIDLLMACTACLDFCCQYCYQLPQKYLQLKWAHPTARLPCRPTCLVSPPALFCAPFQHLLFEAEFFQTNRYFQQSNFLDIYDVIAIINGSFTRPISASDFVLSQTHYENRIILFYQ